MKFTAIKALPVTLAMFFAVATNAQTKETPAPATPAKVATPVVQAKETPAKQTTPPGVTVAKGPTSAQTELAEKKANQINELVKLTPEQMPKVKAAMLESIVKEDQQRTAAKGDKKKMAELDKTRAANREAKLKAILTPAQYAVMTKAVEKSKSNTAK
ncbi:MAG: hypothetical protein JWO06_863 [Bacteroidota bacterium]|nr:hypothetical protein [Bacteroidota bacterium]